jgi:hypothetical protein
VPQKRTALKAGRGWSQVPPHIKVTAIAIKVCGRRHSSVEMPSIGYARMPSAHLQLHAPAHCLSWQVLARACVPDGQPQQTIPAAVKDVAASLTSRLLQLLDPDAEQLPVADIEAAALRLAAATALLRLARCHDSLLTAKGYRTLALVIQVMLCIHSLACLRRFSP